MMNMKIIRMNMIECVSLFDLIASYYCGVDLFICI